jgi:hypothetical protein
MPDWNMTCSRQCLISSSIASSRKSSKIVARYLLGIVGFAFRRLQRLIEGLEMPRFERHAKVGLAHVAGAPCAGVLDQG